MNLRNKISFVISCIVCAPIFTIPFEGFQKAVIFAFVCVFIYLIELLYEKQKEKEDFAIELRELQLKIEKIESKDLAQNSDYKAR